MANDSTVEQYTGLPLDEQVDAIIAAYETGDAQQMAAAAREVGDAQRFAWGMGRALKRLKARDDELKQQAKMVLHEIGEAGAKLAPQIRFLEEQLETITRERRNSGAGNFLDIPGVGRWSARKVAAGWDINDEKAVLASLEGDDRALYVEDVPKLKNAEFREHLDETGEVPPGVERRPERIGVTYKLSDS